MSIKKKLKLIAIIIFVRRSFVIFYDHYPLFYCPFVFVFFALEKHLPNRIIVSKTKGEVHSTLDIKTLPLCRPLVSLSEIVCSLIT